jgi:hypothetical protein
MCGHEGSVANGHANPVITAEIPAAYAELSAYIFDVCTGYLMANAQFSAISLLRIPFPTNASTSTSLGVSMAVLVAASTSAFDMPLRMGLCDSGVCELAL